MELTFKVEGLKELEAALIELADEYGPKKAVQSMRPAVKAATDPVEQAIRSSTPADTGNLAASTRTRIGKPTGKMLRSVHFHKDMVIAARVGWTWSGENRLWNQALAVEFGTAQQSGNAVLWSAIQQHSEQMAKTFGETLGPAIEKKAASLNKRR